MSDKLYFCGSVYVRVKRGRGVKECIQKAKGLDGHLMTSWNGKPVLVSEGKLYVWAGKEKEFRSPWSNR